MRVTKCINIWEILKNKFKGNDNIILVKLKNLEAYFDNICTKDGENIKDLF